MTAGDAIFKVNIAVELRELRPVNSSTLCRKKKNIYFLPDQMLLGLLLIINIVNIATQLIIIIFI